MMIQRPVSGTPAKAQAKEAAVPHAFAASREVAFDLETSKMLERGKQ